MASGIEASSIQSLDDLYECLNEKELNKLKPLMDEWEFDLGLLKDDINDAKEGELKDEIPEELMTKIKSILNGDYNNNDELSIFKNKLKQKMSNKRAAQVIIDKIKEDEMDMDAIEDDIDDRDNSAINEALTDENLADGNWKEFCDIVNKNNNTLKTNNSSKKPHISSQINDNSDQKLNDTDEKLLKAVQENFNPQSNKKFENQYKVDKVKVDLKLESVMTLTKNKISNSTAGKIIIDKIKEEGYQFDDIQEDIKDQDNSEIWDALNSQELENKDDIFNKFKQIINNIDQGPHTQQRKEEEEEEKIFEQPERLSLDTEFVDDENGKIFKELDHIQKKLNEMNIGLPPVQAGSVEAKQAVALTKLWCIFGANQVQEMIDLEMLHLAIAFNQATYSQLHDHLTYYEKEASLKKRANFYTSNAFSPSYSVKQFLKKSLRDLPQGLKQYISTRFLGYDKYKGIMNDHKKLQDGTGDDDEIEESDNDEDDDYHVQEKTDGDQHMYYPVYPVQTFLIGFYIALTKYLLNDSSESTVSIALDVVLPIIKRKDKFNHDIMNESFKDMIEYVTLKFEQKLKELNYEKGMKRNHVCQWKIKFDENGNAPIKEPLFVGYSKKEDIGFEMNQQEFEKYFKDFQLFEIMRVKRLHKTAKPDTGTRFGIGLHKFGKTIKMYIHYAEGFVMRFQLQDISKWFKLLFGNNKWYHQNEINEEKWSERVSRYLQKVLDDMINLNDLKPYENPYKLQHGQDDYKRKEDCVWKTVKKWTDVDKDFNDKNEKFKQHLLQDPGMQNYRRVYQ